MTRNPEALTGRTWDLLIVGGGIHGLFAACDAAQRGLSVALVEAGDFGGGLSFNHQRTLHGGLRALQSLSLRKVREQLNERRTWARIAPLLIRPLPFLIGTYRGLKRSRLAMHAGFAAYDLAGLKRNAGVPAALHIPRARLASISTTRRLFPKIDDRGLTGGAVWYDYQMIHPDRLTWLVAEAADAAGARLVNYVEAIGPVGDGERIRGARVRDVFTGHECEVHASVTLLAAGAGIVELMHTFKLGEPPPMVRAMNVLLDRPAPDVALAAPGASRRMLTAVPWHGAVLVGTYQSDGFAAPHEAAVPAAELDAFIDDIRAAFPALNASRDAVRLIQHGLTPAVMAGARADLRPESVVVRHGANGRAGVISLIGVKYTTARLAAERAVDAVYDELGKRPHPCRTDRTTLPHAGLADVEGQLLETQRELHVAVDRDVLSHLAGWYGTEANAVLRWAHHHRLLDRLSPSAPVLAGEVSYAIASLAAARLSDVVLRRTSLGTAGHPGRPALAHAARLMAQRLGWSDRTMADEIAAVEARFTSP